MHTQRISLTHLLVDCHWSVKDSVHPQNGRLGWVDDGCAIEGAKHSSIADSERPSIHVLHS